MFAWILLGGLATLPVRLGPLVALVRLVWILLGGLVTSLPLIWLIWILLGGLTALLPVALV